MDPFGALERFVFQTPWWRLVAILFGVMLLKTGIWYYPAVGSLIHLSADPFFQAPGAGVSSFLHYSWLSAFLGWLTGFNSEVSFVLLHVSFSVAFFGGMAWLFKTELGEACARTALVIFVALPMSYVSFFWFGPDSLTLLLMLLILSFRRVIWIVFLLSIALGLQHFEQSFVGVTAAIGAVFIARILQFQQPIGLRPLIAILVGVVLGRLVFSGAVWWFEIPMTASRLSYLQEHNASITFSTAKVLQTALWSAMGAAWLVLIRLWSLGRMGWAPTISVLLLSLIIWVVADHTRVFAISSVFLLANAILLNKPVLEKVGRGLTTIVLLVWLLVPVTFVWGSGASGSLIFHDAQVISNILFGWPDVSIFEEWGPF